MALTQMFASMYNVMRQRKCLVLRPIPSSYPAARSVSWLAPANESRHAKYCVYERSQRSGCSVILFKACPRCGGDVDATYHSDVYCVQCSYRPAVVFPGPRIVEGKSRELGGEAVAKMVCPSCGSERAIRLDRLRPQDNACYRCRSCGHIYSPGSRAIGGDGRYADFG